MSVENGFSEQLKKRIRLALSESSRKFEERYEKFPTRGIYYVNEAGEIVQTTAPSLPRFEQAHVPDPIRRTAQWMYESDAVNNSEYILGGDDTDKGTV